MGERDSVAVGNGSNGSNGKGAEMRRRNRGSFDSERAREAGRRSAEARRLKALEERGTPPTTGNEEARVPPQTWLRGAQKVSEPRDLHQLSEDALVDLLKSPSETARVQAAKVLHERSQPRPEPEPVGDAPRAHSLVDLLEFAAKAGLDVSEEAVIAAIPRGMLARDAERAVMDSSATPGLKVMNEPCDVPAASTADAEAVGGLRRALGSSPS
jgi:hypothetical protein